MSPFLVFERPTNEVCGWCDLSVLHDFLKMWDFCWRGFSTLKDVFFLFSCLQYEHRISSLLTLKTYFYWGFPRKKYQWLVNQSLILSHSSITFWLVSQSIALINVLGRVPLPHIRFWLVIQISNNIRGLHD